MDQGQRFEEIINKTPVFVELMKMFLECDDRIQEVIREIVEMLGSEFPEDRERAYGTIAGALLTSMLPVRKQSKSKDFAGRLKALRSQHSWTQTELAEKSGLTQSTISAMESGKFVPTSESLEKLAKALGVPLEELYP